MITILYFILAVFAFIYAAGFGATLLMHAVLAKILNRTGRDDGGSFLIALVWPVAVLIPMLKRR